MKVGQHCQTTLLCYSLIENVDQLQNDLNEEKSKSLPLYFLRIIKLKKLVWVTMFFWRLADRGKIVYFSGRPPSLGSLKPFMLGCWSNQKAKNGTEQVSGDTSNRSRWFVSVSLVGGWLWIQPPNNGRAQLSLYVCALYVCSILTLDKCLNLARIRISGKSISTNNIIYTQIVHLFIPKA